MNPVYLEDMSQSIENSLLWSVMGDAMGTPLNGLKPEAIQAVYRDMNGYIDPAPHLKKHMIQWIRPGYYSCLTQINLLLFQELLSGKPSSNTLFIKIRENSISDLEHQCGIFRHVQPSLCRYLREEQQEKLHGWNAFFSAFSLPFMLCDPQNPERALDRLTDFILEWSDHALSLTPALAAGVLYCLLIESPDLPRRDLLTGLYRKTKEQEEKLIAVRSRDLSPASLADLHIMSTCLEDLCRADDPDDDEIMLKIIIQNAHKHCRQDVTRAGHPYPPASVCTALYAGTVKRKTADQSILSAVRTGGLSGLTGLITGACAGLRGLTPPPEHWMKELANHRHLSSLASAVGSGHPLKNPPDFYKNEYGLSRAVEQDLLKLLKKYPVKKHPLKSSAPKMQDMILRPCLPDKKKDPRKWREFEKIKTKEKRKRRKR